MSMPLMPPMPPGMSPAAGLSSTGSTIWMKLIFDFILSRQAHSTLGKKK